MSKELRESHIIACGPVAPPRVEMYSGQYVFRLQEPEGTVVEKLVSSKSLVDAFARIGVDTGWIPSDVRRSGHTTQHGEWAVLFVPPALHDIEVISSSPDAQGGVDRLRVPLPGLVVFGVGVKYYVWAVKGEDLQPHREIFRCPLPNVEPDAAICYGGHQPPRCTPNSIRGAFDIFMRTPFNNHRCDGKSKRAPNDVRERLAELARGGDTALYPVDDLVRQVEGTGVTLDAAIRGFFEDGEMPS